MAVLTDNRRKNMPTCFSRHTVSNGTLERRIIVHFDVTLNFQTEHAKSFFFRNSASVQACRPLQSKFYQISKHFQNQRGTNSTTLQVNCSGWSTLNIQD